MEGRSSRAGCVESKWNLSSSDIKILYLTLTKCCYFQSLLQSEKSQRTHEVTPPTRGKRPHPLPTSTLPHSPQTLPNPHPPRRIHRSCIPTVTDTSTPRPRTPQPARHGGNLPAEYPTRSPCTQQPRHAAPQRTSITIRTPAQFRFLPKHALRNVYTPFTCMCLCCYY